MLLAILALGVAILLARGSHPVVGTLLVGSALGVSAILFLPTQMLGAWFGMDHVHRLYGLTRSTPLDPPEWIHLLAFAWLGLLIRLARTDLRNWRGLVLVAALGVAAELSQWLTDGRQPRVEDAALNVAGGLAGILLAQVACALVKRARPAKP
ncbi:MAG TPA: VanZ family protein [Luteimonas sp.]